MMLLANVTQNKSDLKRREKKKTFELKNKFQGLLITSLLIFTNFLRLTQVVRPEIHSFASA